MHQANLPADAFRNLDRLLEAEGRGLASVNRNQYLAVHRVFLSVPKSFRRFASMANRIFARLIFNSQTAGWHVGISTKHCGYYSL
jgi:hypothetical protein